MENIGHETLFDWKIAKLHMPTIYKLPLRTRNTFKHNYKPLKDVFYHVGLGVMRRLESRVTGRIRRHERRTVF